MWLRKEPPLLVLLLWVAGCGVPAPAIVPVSGQVTLNGQPLAQGCVCFASPDGYASSAPLQPDGSFRLVSQYGKGIPPGRYRVTVVPSAEEGLVRMTPETKPRNPATHVIPTKYRYAHSSGLTAAVDVRHRVFTFDLVDSAVPRAAVSRQKRTRRLSCRKTATFHRAYHRESILTAELVSVAEHAFCHPERRRNRHELRPAINTVNCAMHSTANQVEP